MEDFPNRWDFLGTKYRKEVSHQLEVASSAYAHDHYDCWLYSITTV